MITYQCGALVGMKILVYGWYGNTNLGDEAFKDAFRFLFPQHTFKFGNHIPADVNSYDAVWFGGGSFFDGPLVNPSKVEIKKPIAFIGIGLPAKPEAVPATTLPVLKQAKLILCRDSASVETAKALGLSATQMPDLALATPNLHPRNPKHNKVTIFCNDNFTPRLGSPEYMILAFYWFMSEFSSVCNMLIEKGYELEFVPMGVGDIDDRRFAAMIHSRITKKAKAVWQVNPFTHSEFEKAISESALVISQRFHGVVFSIKYGVPFVSINAADKFASLMKDMGVNSCLDYYGFTKVRFLDAMEHSDITATHKFYLASVESFQKVQKLVNSVFSG